MKHLRKMFPLGRCFIGRGMAVIDDDLVVLGKVRQAMRTEFPQYPRVPVQWMAQQNYHVIRARAMKRISLPKGFA